MATQFQITKSAALQSLVAAPLLAALPAPAVGWATVRDEYRSARRAFERVAKPLETKPWEDLPRSAQAANRAAGARLDAAYDAIINCPAPDVRALHEKANILLVECGEIEAASGFAILHADIARLTRSF
jgi:hypothetical protein